jgi:hypothetical protein
LEEGFSRERQNQNVEWYKLSTRRTLSKEKIRGEAESDQREGQQGPEAGVIRKVL